MVRSPTVLRGSALRASLLAPRNDGWPTNHARPPQDDGRPRTTRDRRFRTARPSRRRPLMAGTVTDFAHRRKGSRNFARRNRAHPGAEHAPGDVTRITRPYRQVAFIRGPAGASAVCAIFQPGFAVSIEREERTPYTRPQIKQVGMERADPIGGSAAIVTRAKVIARVVPSAPPARAGERIERAGIAACREMREFRRQRPAPLHPGGTRAPSSREANCRRNAEPRARMSRGRWRLLRRSQAAWPV